MRLSELKAGQTYMVETPVVRLATVIEQSTFEKVVPGGVEAQGEPTMVSINCVIVRATVPAVPIPGVVTKKAAKRGNIIRPAVRGVDDDQEMDWRVWKEVWCERRVGKLVRRAGMTALTVSEKPGDQIAQVYCEALTTLDDLVVSGRKPEVEGSPLRSSGISGSSVEPLVLIEKRLITTDPFELPVDEPEAVAEVV